MKKCQKIKESIDTQLKRHTDLVDTGFLATLIVSSRAVYII